MGTERDIDDAIDRAVRDIMSVEPPVGLRGRVLTRLQQPASRGLVRPLFAAAALTAAALLAFALLRPAPQPVPGDTLAGVHRPGTPRTSPAVQPEPPAPPHAAESTGPRPASPRSTRPTRPSGPVRFPPRGVVAAASLVADAPTPPVAVALPEPVLATEGRPQYAPIRIEAIDIAPLTIAPVAVAPIPPSR